MSGRLDIDETAGLKHDIGSESYGVPEFCIQSSLLTAHAAIILEFFVHFRQELIPHTLLTRSDSLFRGVNQCIALKDDK